MRLLNRDPPGVATSGTLPWTSIATVTCISAWSAPQSNGIRPSVDVEPNAGVHLHSSTSHASRTSFFPRHRSHRKHLSCTTPFLSLSLSPSPSQDIAPEAHSCTGILCHAGSVSAKSSRTRAQRGGESGAYVRPLQSRADSQCGGSYFAGQWGERGIDSSVAPGTTLVRGTRAPSGMDTRTLLARRLALSFQSWGMGREYDATST